LKGKVNLYVELNFKYHAILNKIYRGEMTAVCKEREIYECRLQLSGLLSSTCMENFNPTWPVIMLREQIRRDIIVEVSLLQCWLYIAKKTTLARVHGNDI